MLRFLRAAKRYINGLSEPPSEVALVTFTQTWQQISAFTRPTVISTSDPDKIKCLELLRRQISALKDALHEREKQLSPAALQLGIESACGTWYNFTVEDFIDKWDMMNYEPSWEEVHELFVRGQIRE